ncbi:MAG: hypothetical protein JRJ39_05715 [Deltaproteobacteria bacterium]|nr:hypothetical protein [Deltaproteobacteria bacterium]MBW1846265.1 hypothetical protein [Deltaproteobacteria bacterium]MBW2181729.1 hypothetical protein [Deltaproteobacteria bacterium]MBW2364315.1 hypothetical protein [Deltaproteobacteria bacterium]
MSKLSFMAFMFLIGSILLLGFQSIGRLMGAKGVWKGLSLIKLFGPKYFYWLDDISFFGLEDILIFIANMPLFAFLFCMSILFFILDKFYSK